MELQFESDMLTGYSRQAQRVSLSRETWKESVGEKIQNKQSQKFRTILSLEQQEYVLKHLCSWNLDDLFLPQSNMTSLDNKPNL